MPDQDIEFAKMLTSVTMQLIATINKVEQTLQERLRLFQIYLDCYNAEIAYDSLEFALNIIESSIKEAYLVKSWRFLTLECKTTIIQFSNGKRFYLTLKKEEEQ